MGHIRAVIAFATVFACTPAYFLFWLSLHMISLLFPVHIRQRIDDYLYDGYQSFVLFFVETLSENQIVLYGDWDAALSGKERVLAISNHQSTADWIIANALAGRQNSLGHVRFIVKAEVLLVPIYGMGNYLHGMVFIDRKNFDAKAMQSSLNHLKNKKISSWIVLYPEGTTFNPNSKQLIDKSNRYARSQGLTPLRNLLHPRKGAFHIILENLKNNFDSCYDMTIVYVDKTGKRVYEPTIFNILSTGGYTVHVHMKRFDIEELLIEAEDSARWLYERFQIKDQMLEGYNNFERSSDAINPFANGKVSPPSILKNTVVLAFFVSQLLMIIASSSFFRYIQLTIFEIVLSYVWFAVKNIAQREKSTS